MQLESKRNAISASESILKLCVCPLNKKIEKHTAVLNLGEEKRINI